jgi:hypothetical protein
MAIMPSLFAGYIFVIVVRHGGMPTSVLPRFIYYKYIGLNIYLPPASAVLMYRKEQTDYMYYIGRPCCWWYLYFGCCHSRHIKFYRRYFSKKYIHTFAHSCRAEKHSSKSHSHPSQMFLREKKTTGRHVFLRETDPLKTINSKGMKEKEKGCMLYRLYSR